MHICLANLENPALVELVRSLIQEQEQLQSETKKQQAADLLK